MPFVLSVSEILIAERTLLTQIGQVFYFIRPTPANLNAYERWSGNETAQATVWLGDWCDEVVKVELTAGNTMLVQDTLFSIKLCADNFFFSKKDHPNWLDSCCGTFTPSVLLKAL
jgi:hypothetical protein